MSPYKECTKLLQLPVELLIEIFSYISDRGALAFVCQRFYQIICLLERNLCILSIKDESSLLNNGIFSSVISSHRNITGIKVRIGINYSDLFWSRFEAIVSKLRHSIESLDITFIDVPQTFPSDYRLISILHLLPVQCPKVLKITHVDVEYLSRFIRSRHIRDLEIIGAVKDVEIFNKINLSKLKLIAPKCSFNEAIKFQRNLTYFKLIADETTVIDSETLKIIENLEKLEGIDIPLVDMDSNECIRTFLSMKNLTNLKFQSGADFAFDICNSIGFPNITEMDITVPSEILMENIFENIAVKFPNLKSLGLRTPMALKIFKNMCISSLITIDSLLIENIFYGFVGITILDLHDYNIIQRKVKRLILMNNDRKVIICRNDLLKLLKLFPCLECLVLSGYFDTQNYLESLLKSMKALKELVIVSSINHSTTHIMGIIKEYGIHLRMIVLENFKSGCDVENLKMFFEDQFPSIEKKNSNLVLKKHGNLVLKDFS